MKWLAAVPHRSSEQVPERRRNCSSQPGLHIQRELKLHSHCSLMTVLLWIQPRERIRSVPTNRPERVPGRWQQEPVPRTLAWAKSKSQPGLGWERLAVGLRKHQPPESDPPGSVPLGLEQTVMSGRRRPRLPAVQGFPSVALELLRLPQWSAGCLRG